MTKSAATDTSSEAANERELLRAKINMETAKMPWAELQRYFAAGMVIVVSDSLDLVEVAARIAEDDKESVAQWVAEKRVAQISDSLAQAWSDADALLWTVVVKPWILVQTRAS